MAFDPQWLAVGGLAVAATAAIASPIGAYFVTRAQLDHRRKLAAIERRQRRLEATYRGTIEYLIFQRDWVVASEPFMSVVGEPAPPAPMDPKELAAREADVVMNGSPEVLGRLKENLQLADHFKAAVTYLRALRASHAPGDPGEWENVRQDVSASRKKLLDAIGEILETINTELREE